ncbi:MAG: hypothetical protein WKF80_05380, partial [Thermomicrobiales bacterium]
YAQTVPQGVDLARAIEALLNETYPDLFGDSASETFALPEVTPFGRVDFQIFLFAGCDAVLPPSPPA